MTISNVASAPSATSAVITWTTNVQANSNAYCSLASGNSFSRCGTTHNATLATSHQMTFTGLTSSTNYKYHVISCTGGGICAESVNYIFTTTSGSTITLNSIAVTPSSASVSVGGTRQFSATGTYSDGSSGDVTSSSAWRSSNTAIATMAPCSTFECATGIAAGTATISAVKSGKTGTASLSVTAIASSGSFFPTQTPDTADAGNDSSVELGFVFTSDLAGTITALKFYKGSSTMRLSWSKCSEQH